MTGRRYDTFTITYLSPISNQAGDEIYFEEYVFNLAAIPEQEVWQYVEDLKNERAALIDTTEGLLYLNGSNIASIMFHEEDI
ncbi:hypothetical protein EC55P2_00033 [Enterococcus phage EC55P2]|nr:hypothetical protein EC55P2_00033 [Enterococcus phage EC55P2]